MAKGLCGKVIGMKKVLSLLLAILLVALTVLPSLAAEVSQASIPTVYIGGKAVSMVTKPDGTPTTCGEVPDGYIEDAVKACLPTMAKGILIGDMSEYYAQLLSYVAPLYSDIQLDNGGNAQNEVYCRWSFGTLSKNVKTNYGITEYYFNYDWRLSPIDNAEILSRYVDAVCAATNSQKVNLVGRCEGGVIVDAYLAYYGHSKVNKIIYYASAGNELTGTGEAFSGDLRIDPDGVVRFAALNLDIEDEFLSEFLNTTVAMLYNASILETLCINATAFLNRYILPVVPDLIMCSYGTFPSVWSMLSADTYESARDMIFAGKEEQYAELIEKIDRYQNDVKLHAVENLQAAQDDGVSIATVVKYGSQGTPLTNRADDIGDDSCTVNSATFGATTAPAGTVLSEDYIAAAIAEGRGKYISPDKQIDTSTSMFKDTTWAIKYMEHSNISSCVHPLLLEFLRSQDGMTIDTDERYPAFLVYDGATDTIAPMTEKNSASEKWDGITNIGLFESIVKFLKMLFELIKTKLF